MRSILFVTDEMKYGGVSAALVELLDILDYQKYEVSVLVLHNHGEFLNRIPKNIQIIPGTLFFNIIDQKFSVLKQQRELDGMFRKLMMAVYLKSGLIRSLIRRERKKMLGSKVYDVEIAYKDGFCTVFTACGNSGRKLSWIHNDYAVFEGARHYRSLLHRCLEEMDSVVSVSERAADSAKKYFDITQKPEVIANLLDDKKIKKLSREFEPPMDQTASCFVSVGRLSSQKGYDRLLNVHARLIGEGHFHRIYIVGDGEDRQKLESLRSKLGVETSFIFLGYQPNPYPYIAAADCYIMSSRHEAWGLVISEALILGTPVLSTDVADVKSMVMDSYLGVVVDNDEDSLYDALHSILQDPNSLKVFSDRLKMYGYERNDIVMKTNKVLEG